MKGHYDFGYILFCIIALCGVSAIVIITLSPHPGILLNAQCQNLSISEGATLYDRDGYICVLSFCDISVVDGAILIGDCRKETWRLEVSE